LRNEGELERVRVLRIKECEGNLVLRCFASATDMEFKRISIILKMKRKKSIVRMRKKKYEKTLYAADSTG